jgi:hypothetical protein
MRIATRLGKAADRQAHPRVETDLVGAARSRWELDGAAAAS